MLTSSEQERAAGEVEFGPVDAVKLDGVTAAFVDLQGQLRRVEDERGRNVLRALFGREQGYGLLTDASGIAGQVELGHKLEATRRLVAERVGVGAVLDFAVPDRRGADAAAGLEEFLLHEGTLAVTEGLALALPQQLSVGRGHAGDGAHRAVGRQQQVDLLVERDREGVARDGCMIATPASHSRPEVGAAAGHGGAGARDGDGLGGGAVDRRNGKISRSGEAPGAIDESAHADTAALAACQRLDRAVLDDEALHDEVDDPRVGVPGPARHCCVQRALDVFCIRIRH